MEFDALGFGVFAHTQWNCLFLALLCECIRLQSLKKSQSKGDLTCTLHYLLSA